jgi:hypothetical protein
LHEHLDRDVVGDPVFVDQAAEEVKLRVCGRREADLDLFEADADQQVEKLEFLVDRHRLWQRLVAIAQVDRAPNRCVGQRLVWPRAVGQGHRREGPVF